MTHRNAIVATAVSALLAACGGSSGPSASGATARGMRGTVTARSTGSLTVNGIAFSLDNQTAIRVEKTPATDADLRQGMVVLVKGEVDDRTGTGRASEVEFEDDIQGRSADDVAAGATAVTVGGRRVHLEDSTRVTDDKGNDVPASSLRRDDRLRVSGFPDDQGRFRASSVERIAPASADDSFEAKGFVTAIAADRASFDMSLTPGGPLAWQVRLASGTLAAAIAVGSFVEIRAASAASGTAVTAASVALEDQGVGEVNEEVEVEGIVTSGSAAAFAIGGQQVTTSSATRWEFGVADDLVPSAKVEAEGRLDASGVLVARKVSFRASVRLEGKIAVAPGGGLSLLGLAVETSELTRIEDAPVDGQQFEVRGMTRRDASGAVTGIAATRIRSRSSGGGGGDKVVLQGVVDRVIGTASLEILGFAVDVAGARFFAHRTADDGPEPPITADAFFAAVTAGQTVVKASGKVRPAPAPSPIDVGTRRFAPEELELEDEPEGM
jgi:hypothetical protein